MLSRLTSVNGPYAPHPADKATSERSAGREDEDVDGVGQQDQDDGGESPTRRSMSKLRSMVSATIDEIQEAERRTVERSKKYGEPSMLVPVAVYRHPTYLQTAAEIILEFNKKGLIITPWLYSTVVAVASTVHIQASWRAHRFRKANNVGELLLWARAATCIQRAFRACKKERHGSALHVVSARNCPSKSNNISCSLYCDAMVCTSM